MNKPVFQKKIIGASSFASPLGQLRDEVDSIELYVPKLGLYDGRRLIKERINELCDIFSTGSTLTTMHAPYYSDTPNYPGELVVDTASMGKTQFKLMEECIYLAGQLECSVVVVHPGIITGEKEKCFGRMIGNLGRLARSAENCGVTLGLENKEGTNPLNLCCEPGEYMRAIEEVDSPNLAATFDIGHANLTCGGDQLKLQDFIKELDNVVHVHVHDNTGIISEKYFGDLHGAPGEGCIDFSVLSELHCKGVYNLEVFSMDNVRKGKKMLEELN
ncbi:MAG: sugar phosphate isomerase/epimerase [Candidatus Methanoperedens sp.]|nr:sugar phosphate isomerase/epimerase [Candidatus Methanoperedens sp.]MCE8427447.1 sugar phosphate isomerase/epimerase [Candidatus Methanoperedens sp.]